MKTKKFALLIILSMLVTGFAGAGSYIVEDDIYYNPNDKNPVVEKKEKEAQKELQEKAAVKKTLMATSDNHFRDVDEYNRRGESSDMTLEDIAANQKEDHVEYNVVDENGDDGYYLNGFNGSDSDYEYALRIRRFHNPKFVVSVSDPFYSDIYFLDNNDWNVYISDNYAWVTPTWTNPWYWNYTWAPYSYTSWSWRWSLGPWGFSFGYDLFTVGAVIGAGIHGIVLLSTTITIIIITIVLTMVGTDRIVLSTLPTAALLIAMVVVLYLPGTLLHRAGGVRLSVQGLREIRPVVVRLEM